MKFRQLNYSLHMAVGGLVGRRETAHKSNQLWNHFRTNYEIKFTELVLKTFNWWFPKKKLKRDCTGLYSVNKEEGFRKPWGGNPV